ncbi:MAG TPA: hypothetical protein VN778_00625 [Verrucomicrobiae bacterium]|nr:hypothetical protein [Verrucomicrobiae bacterium]
MAKKEKGGLPKGWLLALITAAVCILLLLINRLGSLTGGVSAGEVHAATAPVGWHGIYHNPFYLPLKLARSVAFFLFSAHGQTITRLPNVLFGIMTIAAFIILVKLWHSTRTAVLASFLFVTSAWVLHASRLASFDVIYLWALPILLLSNVLINRSPDRGLSWYFGLLTMGMLLYVPGMVWLILVNIFFLRHELAEAWAEFSYKQHILFILASLIWLPLLIVNLLRPSQLLVWLGLPTHWPTLKLLLKQFIGVPVHLFIRGPQQPDLWLGRAPILDIFTLVACILGIYFYLRHLKANRTRLLACFAIIGWLLVTIGGPVTFSLLVPLLYLAAATGIAYLLHEWLRVFPLNPLARGLGVTLVTLAVGLACIYNLRAYFVAWPHDQATRATFIYHLRH